MAITVVQSSQSAGGGNASSTTLSAATAGNTIVSCFSQTSTTTPTLTGYTINATKGVYNSSGDSVWIAYKIAAGGETSVSWTGGSTGHGCCAWEIAGAATSITLDGSVVTTDNLSAATGGRAVTTGTAGSIILIGVGANASTGTISAWTGTNVATNISTSAARCFGGSFITSGTVSSTFTANWATSHVAAMIAIALQPSGGGGGGGTATGSMFGLF